MSREDEVVDRDERTLAVENAGYRWSYLGLSFGALAIVAYRAFVHDQTSWDLLGLVILGGAFNAAYQRWHKIVYRRWIATAVTTFVAAALLAGVLALLRKG